MYRKLSGTLIVLAILLTPSIANAHVLVTPAKAGIGQEVLFNVSAPNEKPMSVVKVSVTVPSDVTNVTPTAKTGWTITTEKSGEMITSITWSEGRVPSGQRDDFSFMAQVPDKSTDLNWKAYQTYDDASVTHWDQKPSGSDDATGDAGPYSITKVSDDLTSARSTVSNKSSSTSLLPTALSVLAIILAVYSITKKQAKK